MFQDGKFSKVSRGIDGVACEIAYRIRSRPTIQIDIEPDGDKLQSHLLYFHLNQRIPSQADDI